MEKAQGFAQQGNSTVTTSGLASTTVVEGSFPLCHVTVNLHGGGLATIYSDDGVTPLANPFTANSDGSWAFYAANNRYDVTLSDNSGSGPASPVVISDLLLNDPAGGGGNVVSVFGRTGTVIAQTGDYSVAQVTGAAPLASPTFTGTVVAAAITVPTVSIGDNSTNAASTAFVKAQGYGTGNGNVSNTGTPVSGQVAEWTSATVVQGRSTTGTGSVVRAADPALTGVPTAPTASFGDNTTTLATTAFVQAALAGTPVLSVFGRTGAVVAASADYSVGQVTGAAPLASPTFTGTPVGPTPGAGDNSTKLATTAFVYTAFTNLPLVVGSAGTSINQIVTALGVAPGSPYGSISAQTGQEQDFTVTGAATTGIAMASPVTDLGNTGLSWSARVKSADTVSVRVVNSTSGSVTPSAVNWNIVVVQ